MSTDAQINANRQNARQSTGPRTDEGKTKVAQNATKHGLFSQKNVVIPENQADYDAVRDEMLKDLEPVGAMEAILAERIVSLTWRLKRAARMQDEVIDVRIRLEINCSKPWLSESLITGEPCELSKNPKRCYDDLALGLIAKWDFEADRVLERLSMYERRFEKSLFKTMAELRATKAARLTAQADQVQDPPQAEEKANSEKQSQSGEDEVPRANLPDMSDVEREKVMAFAKRTWGEPLPQRVKAGLRRLGVSVDEGEALPDGPSATASPQIQGVAGREGVALSMASL